MNFQELIDNLTTKQLRELRGLLDQGTQQPVEAAKIERAVLITTEHRGVFFGYTAATDEEILANKSARVRSVRNCVYWSADVKGFGGLTTSGPTANCKIGPAIPSAQILAITGVWDCSPEAVKAWESAPWAK